MHVDVKDEKSVSKTLKGEKTNGASEKKSMSNAEVKIEESTSGGPSSSS